MVRSCSLKSAALCRAALVSTKSSFSSHLPSVAKTQAWLESLEFPLAVPYLVQHLIAQPLLVAGRICIFRAYAVVVRRSPLLVVWHLGRAMLGPTRFMEPNLTDTERYVTNAGIFNVGHRSAVMSANKVLAHVDASVRHVLTRRIERAVRFSLSALLLDAARRKGSGVHTLSHLCADVMFEHGQPRVLEVNSDCGLRMFQPEVSPSVAESLAVAWGVGSLVDALWQRNAGPQRLENSTMRWEVLLDLTSNLF
eukprot:gnl/TRDRNA2_/TRDRNA2_165269_c1_seq5.p1 gnl/TRDRNA2_/TRDRNA2_165269_c1~~gnl/TRDRNA2_/TRDRNA2_165269_c1_seq5.p1  ORF type:complete len:252 (+),score=21.52 gnl/TRDRNA2_/TRDRNA2_165269_c1_seq5:78-833(+)